MRRAYFFRSVAVAAIIFGAFHTLNARGQTPASSTSSTADPSQEQVIRALAAEIHQLNATVQELRTEVQNSTRETNDLRTELHNAVEHLSANPVSAVAPSSQSPANAKAPTPVAPPSPRVIPPSSVSTEARLDRLEEDQELLQAKVDEHHQTKVESQSKYRVKLGGIALFNLFGNSGTVDNQDIPNVALPRSSNGPSGSVGATLRQSEIGLEVYGPRVGGGQVSASVNTDFMGGFSSAPNGVTSDIVHLRTAVMRIDWSHTSIVAGQDTLFFSPLTPTSLASLGYPAFADAGNLWTWTPQIRVERRVDISDLSHLIFQGGVLDPLSGETPYSQYYRTPGPGEQSRAPAVGSRAAWTHGVGDRALTLGIGGYFSRQNYGNGRNVDAWAGTADWSAPLGNRFALSGEFYRGRAIGGLGAAQGTSVLFYGLESDPATRYSGLDSIGGWTQLKFKATEAIELNAAIGADDPFSRETRDYYQPENYGYAPLGRNQNALFNVIFRPRSDLVFALEYRYLDSLQTNSSKNTAGTLNLSMGVFF